MNESTVTQLKILVERAVRPVRASIFRKRKMREELLAHVSGVFEQESARLDNDQAALERTALRFGDLGEVTIELQQSVPASDGIRRFLEGRPEESIFQGGSRLAWVTGVLVLIIFVAGLGAAGWVSAWWRQEWLESFSDALLLPVWLFGIALVAKVMHKTLHGSVPAIRLALVIGVLCFATLLCLVSANGLAHAGDWGVWNLVLTAILLAGSCAAWSVFCAWVLVQSAAARRRYHEEWMRLPIEPVP